MIGKRTQAYLVGFLVGLAIVSILIDSRRQRMVERDKPVVEWVNYRADLNSLPSGIARIRGKQGYVSTVAQLDETGEKTGKVGFFFANPDGKKFWYVEDSQEKQLYSGEVLKVLSRPGLAYDLMKSGFEHQGHEVLSGEDDIPYYRVRIDVPSADMFIAACENLKSKENFIAVVDWVPAEVHENNQ